MVQRKPTNAAKRGLLIALIAAFAGFAGAPPAIQDLIVRALSITQLGKSLPKTGIESSPRLPEA